jgi:hypothetical protein
MKRRIGEVWFLPPQLEEGGDDKPRRHVLLTPSEEKQGGLFAYATTRTTETRFGAASLYVDPATSPASGFTRPTYVHPARLVLATSDDFMRRTGRLEEVQPLRSVLRVALGLGTGRADADSESWRGKIVRLTQFFREKIGYLFAVVLTEHTYSAQKRYQIIVPLDDLARFRPVKGDLVVRNGTWFRDVSPSLLGVIAAVDEIQSAYHRDHIQAWTGAVIDAAALEAIEAAVKGLFEL